MDQQTLPGRLLGGRPAESYQRYFVPAIGGPMADDLVATARLQPGERVIDVACGTGVLTRLAAEHVGAAGTVTGLDIHPGMLAVGRSATPPHLSIDWIEADAQAMPLPDRAFDVVLCQMGLQFMPDKPAALREMRRVLRTGGRAAISLPGPKPPLFTILAEALARHIGPQAAAFADRVFSLHDVDELSALLQGAGFRNVHAEARSKTLRLPAPAEFLWQYISSTPLFEAVTRAGEDRCVVLEEDVCPQWQHLAVDGSLAMKVGVTTVTATR